MLDVNLPDMTGFEVVERLRRSPEFASIPVLHLSASFTRNADRARGLEQGADAFLTHPIDPAVFVATARALIRASTADRRTREAMREWQATFDALPDAVMLLDQEGVVTRANRAAMTLLGGDDRAVVCAPLRSAARSWRASANHTTRWRTRSMDGDLTVESREGEGSTFVLRLPRAG